MPHRIRTNGLIALLTVVASMTVFSSVADARISSAFFGIQGMSQPSAGDLRTAAGGGVGTYRLFLDRSGIEAQPGVYNWNYPDSIVGNSARAHIRVFSTVLGTPAFDSSHVRWPPTSSAGKTRHYRFLVAAAKRYGPHGSFWRTNKVPYLPITNWQIWNEPNLSYFWLNKVNPGQYLDFLKFSRKALRSVDSHARIILAGMPDRPGTDDPGVPGSRNNIPATTFLTGVYHRRGRGYFDATATHPYSSGVAGLAGAVERVRTVMKRNHDSRKALWVTEFGWSTGGPPSQFRKSAKDQATLTRRALELFIRRRNADHIAGLLYFQLRDQPGTFNNWAPYTGLFYADGRAKLSWSAFRSVVKHAER